MLERVHVSPRSIDSYRGVVPDETMDRLARLARDLRGARVLHVNATPYGGGVSELLRSTIPLLNGLGVIADWKIIRGDARFFEVTKKIHNGLQGAEPTLSEMEREAYLGASKRNAELLDGEYDFIFLHDPQPAAIPNLRKSRGPPAGSGAATSTPPRPNVTTKLDDLARIEREVRQEEITTELLDVVTGAEAVTEGG